MKQFFINWLKGLAVVIGIVAFAILVAFSLLNYPLAFCIILILGLSLVIGNFLD